MNTVEMIFLKSVRCALSGEILKDADDISPSQWKSVFSMAQMHRVLPLVLDAVYSCPGVKALDGESGNLFRKRAREIVLLQTMRTEKFLQIYDRLIDDGVSPILIKGLLCRSLYPNPDCRPSGDEDILICPQETEKAVGIISQMGMQAKDIPYDHNLSADNVDEIAFYGTDNPLHLELHQRLFSSRSETFSAMNALFSRCFEDKITQTIHGRDIYTLSHTDNMLYMMLHCFKHFIHSGFGIRQVCDITLYANQYGHLIDWGKIMADCKAVRADAFQEAILKIAQKHLGLDAQAAGLAHWLPDMTADETPLLEDMLSAGVYGSSSLSRQHSSGFTLNAIAKSEKGAPVRAGLLHSVFPPRKIMEAKYPYLKNSPYLLPAAWADRIIKYRKETKSSLTSKPTDAVKIGKERVELMRYYGIID